MLICTLDDEQLFVVLWITHKNYMKSILIISAEITINKNIYQQNPLCGP